MDRQRTPVALCGMVLSRKIQSLGRGAVLAGACLVLPLSNPARGLTGCTSDAMVVFDGSGSMAEMGFNQLGAPRIFDARKAVRASIPPVANVRRVGLIVYGPGQGDTCDNVALHFAPRENAAPAIIGAIDALAPEGTTPLTRAVARAAAVLDYRNSPGVVVLVTDGKETCGGAPCTLAADLAHQARDLTVHVIGFRVRPDRFNWDSAQTGPRPEAISVARCLADRTGGLYVSAETVQDLTAALRQTLGCAVIGQRPSRHHFGHPARPFSG